MEEKNKEEIKTRPKFLIFIAIDDEISDIHKKIKHAKAKNLYLAIAQNAIIFQSIVNLKLLKKFAKDSKKNIYLITNDANGIFLANSLGIKLYENENKETFKFFTIQDESEIISPLKASVNSIEEDAPKRLSEKKLSISEILDKSKMLESQSALKVRKKNKRAYPKIKIVTPNKAVLFSLISFVSIILITIFYIALPNATIYLNPSASVLEKFVNITLADHSKNQHELDTHPKHMLASYPISLNHSKTISYFSTGKRVSDDGKNASGTIKVINESAFEYPLVARTRFQTEDGIVFRIKSAITVPAKTGETPGSIDVYVEADELDANDMMVGERGNIGPSTFILPGLSDENQKLVYGVSNGNMEGGISDFIGYISEDDLNAAKLKLSEEIEEEALVALKNEVEKITEEAGGDVFYQLLEGDNSLKISDIKYEIPDNLVGAVADSFEIGASVEVSGVYYDKESMLEILRSELITQKSPNKELLRINEESTSYRIFNWDEKEGKIKLTANIKGIEQYQIDEDSEIGEKLQEKIRVHIKGKEIDEATDYIQNLPEVNKVKIESWPAWAPTIPNIPENIEFEVREVITVD